MDNQPITSTGKYSAIFQVGFFLFALCLSGLYNYFLFHALVEIFSIIVSFGIFIVAWNARRFLSSNYLSFVGISFFFIGLFDLFHFLTFGEIGFYEGGGKNISSQMWLVSRYVAAISFILAPFFIRLKKKVDMSLLFYVYVIISIVVFISAFYWQIFPAAYTQEGKISLFNIASEYIISAFFLAAIIITYFYRKEYNKKVLQLLFMSLGAAFISELFFSYYLHAFTFSNISGHLLAVVSYYLFYLGIVETGLMKPYSLLFKDLKDSETAFRESEERYKSLVEFSPDAIVVHSAEKLIYANRAGLKLFGVKNQEEIIGKNLSDFVYSGDKELFSARIKKLENGLKNIPLNLLKIVRRDGKIIDVEERGRIIKYQGKRAIETIMRDITNRKLAIEDASDHIVFTDLNGKILFANKAAEKLTGFTKEEMMGKSPSLWGNLLAIDTHKNIICYKRAWDVINKNNPHFSGEVINRRKNGETYISELRVSPAHDGENNIIYFIAIERDITKLKEIDHAKTEFVSLASHQLRTPLTSISLSTELLLKNLNDQVGEKEKKYLNEIYGSTKKMTKLVNDLLNISRIELGTFFIKSEPINIGKSIDRIINELRIQIGDKRIILSRDYDKNLPIIYFDRNIFEITIENLIANAVKYTPRDGNIGVEIKNRHSDILIKISDTGCGIPKKEQPRVFTKLFRGEKAKEICSEGTGLGLYIVRSVLEKVGSRIWLESKEGAGTVFYVTIPIK